MTGQVDDGPVAAPSPSTLDGDVGGAPPPSRFVEVHVELRVEVTDVPALQDAVEQVDGPPKDDLDRRLREVPANLVGRLVDASRLLSSVPGVHPHGSAVSAGEYDPDGGDGGRSARP